MQFTKTFTKTVQLLCADCVLCVWGGGGGERVIGTEIVENFDRSTFKFSITILKFNRSTS